MPVLHDATATKELVSRIVLDRPLDLSVREIIEPLKQQSTEIDAQLEFATQPPFAFRRGAFEIGQHPLCQDVPRNNESELNQRMVGSHFNNDRSRTTWGMEPRKTQAHGNAFSLESRSVE
jgi:hypothetical protein